MSIFYESIIQGFADQLNPRSAREREARQLKAREDELHKAEAWKPHTRWKRTLILKAGTYNMRSFFKVEPLDVRFDLDKLKKNQRALSPSGQWCYVEKIFPRCFELSTIVGNRRGVVYFDGDVKIPVLHERDDSGYGRKWTASPWMSLTPMEIFSLRGGTDRARGTTVVVGLGLGHQLIEVSKKRNVQKIILIEKSQELVDWLLPIVQTYMGHARHSMQVVVGNAYKEMPKLTADVALVDIFPGYGGNGPERDQLRRDCPNIKYVWAWGTSQLG